MKKMTKWIVACAVCVLGSVPTAGADMNITPEITMTPPEIITPAPEQNEPVITPDGYTYPHSGSEKWLDNCREEKTVL